MAVQPGPAGHPEKDRNLQSVGFRHPACIHFSAVALRLSCLPLFQVIILVLGLHITQVLAVTPHSAGTSTPKVPRPESGGYVHPLKTPTRGESSAARSPGFPASITDRPGRPAPPPTITSITSFQRTGVPAGMIGPPLQDIPITAMGGPMIARIPEARPLGAGLVVALPATLMLYRRWSARRPGGPCKE